jgi:hypothetical protein
LRDPYDLPPNRETDEDCALISALRKPLDQSLPELVSAVKAAAAPARCGSNPAVERRTESDRANGSALRAQVTVPCHSTLGAVGSSAVRRRSIEESYALRFSGLSDWSILHSD